MPVVPLYPAQCSNCPIYLAFFSSTKVKLCNFFSFLCLTYFTQHNVLQEHPYRYLCKVNLWRCQCFQFCYLCYISCLHVYKYLFLHLFSVCLRIHLQCRRPRFNSWVRKICWRRDRLPTPVFWPREFQGLYSPWGHKELDMTEWLSLSLFRFISFKDAIIISSDSAYAERQIMGKFSMRTKAKATESW